MQTSLLAEHEALRRSACALEELLVGPQPENLTQITKMRIEFARLFRSHMAAEQDYAQTCLVSSGKAARKEVEAHFHNMQQLYFDYSRHVHYWRIEHIREDWRGYAHAVRMLRKRLFDQMAEEEEKLLPALALAKEDLFVP